MAVAGSFGCLLLSWFTVSVGPKILTPALGFGFQTSKLNIDRHRLSRADSFKQKSLDAESKECQTCHLFDFDQSWHCALAQWCLSRVVFNVVESRFHHVLLFFSLKPGHVIPLVKFSKISQDCYFQRHSCSAPQVWNANLVSIFGWMAASCPAPLANIATDTPARSAMPIATLLVLSCEA